MTRYEISPRRLNKASRLGQPASPRRIDLDMLIEALNLRDHMEDAQQTDRPNLPGASDLGLPAE
jgi:hypothetical protein